jgi:hypothetical protein
MAYLSPSHTQFHFWELTPKEQEEGSLLTITQRQVIQNQIALLAQESINMIVDSDTQYQWSLRQAELQGSRAALQNLLDASDSIEASRNNSPSHTSSQDN